jgi:hypothetical protein
LKDTQFEGAEVTMGEMAFAKFLIKGFAQRDLVVADIVRALVARVHSSLVKV